MTSVAAALPAPSNEDRPKNSGEDRRLIEAIRAVRERNCELRYRIHALLQAAAPDGFTDEEVAQLLSTFEKRVWMSSVRSTRRELVAAGMVADSQEKRPTSSGALARVWVAE
jgi:hypothetical protein